jgi:hypothetical protein
MLLDINFLIRGIKMKKLLALLAIPLIAATTTNSCNRDASHDFCKYSDRNNISIEASKTASGNSLKITERGAMNFQYGPSITALDNFPVYPDGNYGDGRFDEMKLNFVPKGHELEKYANLDSINELYSDVKESGVSAESYNGEEYNR